MSCKKVKSNMQVVLKVLKFKVKSYKTYNAHLFSTLKEECLARKIQSSIRLQAVQTGASVDTES